MSVVLVMNNRYVRCMSPLAVPRPFYGEYLSSDIEWIVDDVSIPVHNGDHCPLCDRHIRDSSSMRNRVPQFVMCQNKLVNRHVGYQLRICVDCSWWMRVQEGYDVNKVPKTVRNKLLEPFRPVNIDIYLP